MKKFLLIVFILFNFIYASNVNEIEPNDVLQDATNITINDTGIGSLYYNQSTYDLDDWWKFTAPENGILKVYTTDSIVDIDGYIYDENQNQIAYDNSYNTNIDIKLYVEKGKTYYLDLYDYGWGNTDYKLHFDFTPKDINISTNERDFKLRKSFNIHGNSKLIGNSVLCYMRNGECVDTSLPDNDLYLSYVNLEGNSSLFNSTKAEMSGIPDDAEILWVGFYTQGDRSDMGQNQLIAHLATQPSYLISPNGKYYELYPSVIDVYPFSDVYTFSTFTEVKELESNETHKVYGKDINGWWTGANIQTQAGYNRALGFYGAWTMAVVYRYKGETYKNISVFDGYKRVSNDEGHKSVTINISGFLTPLNGPINSTLSLFVGEGDKAYTGDTLSVDGKYINNTNAFDSTILGYLANPSLSNTLGIDIHNYNIGSSGYNIIKNGQTDANITMTSDGDAYYPNLVIFNTDIYVPKICYDNFELYRDGELINNGENLKVGDKVTIKFDVKNMDYENASDVYVLYDYNENNQTSYIENSTRVKNVLNNEFVRLIDNQVGSLAVNYFNGVWSLGVLGDENQTFKSTLLNNEYIAYVEFNNTIENEGNLTFNFYTEYNYSIGDKEFKYNDILPKCEDFNNTYKVLQVTPGYFNVVNENFNSNVDPLDQNATENELYTQIVNKQFNVKILSLDDDNQTLKKFQGILKVDVVGLGNINEESSISSLPSYKSIYVLLNNQSEKLISLDVNKSIKDARFRISFLTDGNGNVIEDSACTDKTLNCIWGLLTQIASERYGDSCPTSGGRLTTGNSDEYCDVYCAEVCNYYRNRTEGGGDAPSNECLECLFGHYSESLLSRDNFAIRPYKFIIDRTTLPSILKAGEEYNLTIKAIDFNGKPVNEYNETIFLSTNLKSPSIEYKDNNVSKGCITGGITINNLDFKDGIANVVLKYNEVGDLNFTIQENNGSEYAIVDEKDSNNPNGLLIEKNSTILKFIPYKFNLISNYKNYNNSSFTYLSNNLNMSSILNLNITAVNKSESVTKNYNKNCYAKNIDINITHSIPNNNLNLIYEINGTEYNISNTQNIIANNITKDYFNNGVANIPVYINFERQPNIPVNEFNFTINNIKIKDINNVEGNLTLNQNANFRYGFFKAKNLTAYDTKDINTTFEYYYFTSNGWVINKEHNSSDFGDINTSLIQKPSDIALTINQQNGKNINDGKESVNISTTHALPYSAKIHLAIPSWLWYHPLAKSYSNPSATNLDCLTHPCMKVTFLKSGSGWAGVGRENSRYSEKNKTVEVNMSIEVNATKNEVKKLNW
ncbi:hypothetical protein [Caminibacter mediatlanticus]|uniref:Uncharacterized protein n=1 Tax=Caminibacter mediatlanticus TB-2 TaxID=391592 RepID=A0AAI9AIV7_9BACT|nr:hypothetical protein [Caminibacter mediatlanticus]EDM24463.1 hypothetical protein CMTB2_03068 [Caminibacter mediatlanticus TB-2]